MIRRSKKGISIIECLISLIILAILLTAGMSFYFLSQGSIRGSIRKKIALSYANSALERIKNEGYTLLPNPATVWTTYTLYPTTSVNIGNVAGERDISVIDRDDDGNGTADYKEIRVIVTWREPGKAAIPTPDTITLVTFMAPSS